MEPTNTATPGTAPDVHQLEAQRRANRDEVAKLGFAPYGQRIDSIIPQSDARLKYDAEANTEYNANSKQPAYADRRPIVTIAGRVVLSRDNGKLIWMNLRDATGVMQIAVSQKDCDERGFKLAKLTDLSDIIVATGRLMETKSGEKTVWCTTLEPGSKSLVPPPEKYAGLTDVEIRYRQRYVDLWANPETMDIFRLRSAIVREALKTYLQAS